MDQIYIKQTGISFKEICSLSNNLIVQELRFSYLPFVGKIQRNSTFSAQIT